MDNLQAYLSLIIWNIIPLIITFINAGAAYFKHIIFLNILLHTYYLIRNIIGFIPLILLFPFCRRKYKFG